MACVLGRVVAAVVVVAEVVVDAGAVVDVGTVAGLAVVVTVVVLVADGVLADVVVADVVVADVAVEPAVVDGALLPSTGSVLAPEAATLANAPATTPVPTITMERRRTYVLGGRSAAETPLALLASAAFIIRPHAGGQTPESSKRAMRSG